MDRQQWKILNVYRNHLMTRLECAFNDGHLDEEQYAALYGQLTAATGFGQLRQAMDDLRDTKKTARTVRVPRWQWDRDRRRTDRQRRWWRPEKFWGIGIVVAVIIGAGALVLAISLIDWISSWAS